MRDKRTAHIVLEDGLHLVGSSYGAIGTNAGEICFNTSMTGYQEVFTDPSYYGQILISTNAHIGNYGTKTSETQSGEVQIFGLISNRLSDINSRFQSDSDLDDYLKEHNIIGIDRVDTRMLVRHIREKGAMNVIISTDGTDIDELKSRLRSTPSMSGLELSSKVSTKEPYAVGSEQAHIKIAAIDYGVKKSILDNLAERGAFIKVFPSNVTIEELKDFNPDGYFLSNGPGDPQVMDKEVELISELKKIGKPIFGICLGHQLLSRTYGVKTFKMHNGHRGINQPVLNKITGLSEITSQNHGFGLVAEDVMKHNELEVTHVNLNDDSIEGVRDVNRPFFSVQYHPEACPGPHDSRYLFDQFINNIKQNNE